MDSCASEYGPLTGCCQHGDEPSGWESSDYLRDNQLLDNDWQRILCCETQTFYQVQGNVTFKEINRRSNRFTLEIVRVVKVHGLVGGHQR